MLPGSGAHAGAYKFFNGTVLPYGDVQLDDLSPLSSMPLLEELSIFGCRCVKSLDPLSGLMNLHYLDCCGIDLQTSLLLLASCTGLKDLWHNRGAKDLEELEEKLPELMAMVNKG